MSRVYVISTGLALITLISVQSISIDNAVHVVFIQ